MVQAFVCSWPQEVQDEVFSLKKLFKIFLAYVYNILKQICLNALRRIFIHICYGIVSLDKAIRKQTWLSAQKALIYCGTINYIWTTLLKIMGLRECHKRGWNKWQGLMQTKWKHWLGTFIVLLRHMWKKATVWMCIALLLPWNTQSCPLPSPTIPSHFLLSPFPPHCRQTCGSHLCFCNSWQVKLDNSSS